MRVQSFCPMVLLACALCIGVASAASPQAARSLEQRNQEVVRRYIEDLWNGQQFDVIEQVLAPDAVFHGADGTQEHGRDRFREVIPYIRSAFPDLLLSIDEMIAQGDRVALRIRVRGTHRGEIFGLPASGNVLDMPEWFFFRIANGKIAEGWYLRDHALLAEQLKQP